MERQASVQDEKILELTGQLANVQSTLDLLQEKYNAKITQLKTHVEICDRRYVTVISWYILIFKGEQTLFLITDLVFDTYFVL